MADIEMDLDINAVPGYSALGDDDVIEYDIDIHVTNPDEGEWMNEDVEIQESAHHVTESDMDAHIEMGNHEVVEAGSPVDVMEVLESLPTVPKSDADMVSELGADDPVSADYQSPRMSAGEPGAFSDTLQAVPETTMEEAERQSVLSDTSKNNEALDEDRYEEGDEALELDLAPESTTLAATGILGFPGEDPVVDLSAAKPSDQHNAVAYDTTQDKLQSLEDELTWEEDEDHDTLSPKENANSQEVDHAQHEDVEAEEDKSAATGQPEQVAEIEAADGELNRAHTNTGRDTAQDEADHGGLAKAEAPESGSRQAPVEEGTNDNTLAPRVADVKEAETKFDEAAPREATPPPRHTHEETLEAEIELRSTSVEAQPYPSITVQYKGEEFPCFAAEDGFFTGLHLVDEPMENLLSGFRSELSAELDANEELILHVDELGLEFAESTQHDVLAGTTLRYLLEIHDMLVQNQDQGGSPRTLYAYLFTRPSTSKRLEFLAESAAHGRGLDEVIHLFEPGMAQQQECHDDSESGAEAPPVENEHSHVSEDAPSIASPQEASKVAVGIFDTDAEERAEGDDTGIDVSEHEAHDPIPPPGEGEREDAEYAEVNVQSVAATTSAPEEAALVLEDHGFNGEFAAAEEADGALHTTATSASSTLNGNDQGSVVDEEGDVRELAEAVNFHGDELAEIDWKDEDEEDEDPTLAVEQNTPSKRARTDDELDFVEQTDVKRQRAS